MVCSRSEGTFPSASGLVNIYYRVWQSTGRAPRAAVQIVHGMAEHGERYEGFAQALCEAGCDVWAMDLLGHGKSAVTDDQLGYFGKMHGWKNLIGDIRQMTALMRDTYPESLPIVLFGHSMGSFLSRAYCERHSEDVAAAVFCGTSAPNPAAAAGILIAKLVAAARGEKHRSPLLDSVAFGNYNSKYPGKPRTKFDWLNTDEAEVDKYIADERCGFLFTAQGFLDLFSLLESVSNKRWFTSMPYQLPMLFIAGDADPVGSFGKGVELVVRRLREAGCNRLQARIFSGMRHEILLEPEHEQVFETVIAWLGKTLEAIAN
ncbi:MAG: alpha/beta hydrolase [Oscillospiraceae bacterium]|nr:alpha/beta hydrolase [Oscillospiraceae bacterium]